MKRVRITIQHSPEDPAADLRRAALIRRDLWSHSPVEIDPDSRAHETHRDADHNAYFEFVTDFDGEVDRVLEQYGHSGLTRVDTIQSGEGAECVNCGNISTEPIAVCANCSFRDIDPCPYCGAEIARLDCATVKGDVFQCPSCQHRVRFRFHDPMFDAGGHHNEPLVLVSRAESPVHHDV